MRTVLYGVTTVTLCVALTASCGDDPPPLQSTAPSSGPTTTSGGGNGGDGAGAGGPDYIEIHECDPDTAEDLTGKGLATIEFGYNGAFYYAPACVRVSPNTTVLFTAADGSNFQIHPLQAGEDGTQDESSPIKFTNDADKSSATFEMVDLGTYPYYCVAHHATMRGAIYVVE